MNYYFWLGDERPASISQSTAERFWEACETHAATLRINALSDMARALGLRLTVRPSPTEWR